ncbi:MAG: hotdog fold thioesterase, partial [Pseudomonadota bacterium]
VDQRTVQPWRILHGGASVVLAETLGSVAAAFCTDQMEVRVVGQEVNANHIRGVSKGWVSGTARPIHLGRRSHVWGIEISDERGKLVCTSRLTIAVVAL